MSESERLSVRDKHGKLAILRPYLQLYINEQVRVQTRELIDGMCQICIRYFKEI
jgi:hypothetical protein